LNKLDEILAAAAKTNDIDELDDLTADAELQGLFAAYLCPVAEIKMEGDLVLDQIDGWGIPKSSTDTARKMWQEASLKLKTPPKDEAQIQQAKGALYKLFAERDAWETSLMTMTKRHLRCGYFFLSLLVPSLPLFCSVLCTLIVFPSHAGHSSCRCGGKLR